METIDNVKYRQRAKRFKRGKKVVQCLNLMLLVFVQVGRGGEVHVSFNTANLRQQNS